MGIFVKKITKKTKISLVSISGVMIAVFIRMIFGGSFVNLSELESQLKSGSDRLNLMTPVAHADIPSGDGDSCTDSCTDGCDGGASADGSGGCSDGSGDGADGSGDG